MVRSDEVAQYVSTEELERYLLDPSRAIQEDFDICLECGKKVSGAFWRHLRDEHNGMTLDEYKQKPGPDGKSPRYSAGTSIVPYNTHRKMRDKALQPARVQQLAAVRQIDKLIAGAAGARSRGRHLSWEFRSGKRRQRLGRPIPAMQTLQDAAFVPLRLEGKNAQEIAKTLGLKSRVSVQRRVEAIGFPTEACLFEHGIPVTGRYVNDLCSDFRLEKRLLANLSRIALPTLISASSPKSQEKTLSVVVAEKLLHWRRSMIEQFCATAKKGDGGCESFFKVSSRRCRNCTAN